MKLYILLVLVLVPTIYCSAMIEEMSDTTAQQTTERKEEEKYGGDVEGDIIPDSYVNAVIRPASEKRSLYKRGFLMHEAETRKWKDGIVYYVLAKNLSIAIKQRVGQAISHIQAATCLQFKRETNPGGWISIQLSKGCHSNLGRTGQKPQILGLTSRCYMGSIVHEFLHALGFFHEQSRRDRNTYVTINYANVKKGMFHNFYKYNHVLPSQYQTRYDYGSIMHYGSTAFSKNGKATIVSKSPYGHIGQRNGLSTIDKKEINTFYCSPKPKTTPQPTPKPTTQPKPQGCYESHTLTTGYIKSPNYPKNYPHNANCKYLITNPDPAKRITLSFLWFNVESGSKCKYDSVKFYDGKTTNAALLGNANGYCGRMIKTTLKSTGNAVLVVFVSDKVIARSGFRISYKAT